MTYSIYIITNLTTGSQYVGVTNNPKDRWSEHRKPGFYGRPITDAILQEGEENFKFEVIATCESEAGARLLESAMIKKLNTLMPNGYNRVEGHGGGRTKVKYQSPFLSAPELKPAPTSPDA